jgi:hypothetical protein
MLAAIPGERLLHARPGQGVGAAQQVDPADPLGRVLEVARVGVEVPDDQRLGRDDRDGLLVAFAPALRGLRGDLEILQGVTGGPVLHHPHQVRQHAVRGVPGVEHRRHPHQQTRVEIGPGRGDHRRGVGLPHLDQVRITQPVGPVRQRLTEDHRQPRPG